MQMSRPSMSQFLRVGEVTYAIVTLFALTQGPIYRLWSESASYVAVSPEPSALHVYFATFVAAQIPSLVILANKIDVGVFQTRIFQLLAGFLSWLGLTLLWSMFARHSVPEFVSLVMTTSFGMYLVVRFSLPMVWWIVTAAMSIGMLLSWIAIWADWSLAVSVEEGYWAGIYFNRNSLAPVAAVALIAAVGVIVSSTHLGVARRVVVTLVCCVVGLSAVTMMIGAESRTSPFALGVAVVVVLVWLATRRLLKLISESVRLRGNSLPIAAVVMAVTVFFAVRLVGGLTGVSGKTATFNSRGVLWSVSWSGFLEKPFHGWGWMAAWRTPNFLRQGEWWVLWNTEWSHNGYHDILLGGGIPAALLFACFLWFGLRGIELDLPRSQGVVTVILVAFVLTAATQESFFIGSHFLWALLIAGISSPFAKPWSADST
jgi:O-antigen ligase